MHPLCEEYKTDINGYEDFRIKIEGLVREILINNDISFHKIESRVKDPLKLEEKIFRKNEKYQKLDQITDLVGIRVITFYEDTVDDVAQALDKELNIDPENSIDKRKLENDRFGYKSLHYVANLKKDRYKLTEYKRFGERKFEIQIRSILQHAWAEIEHDLGYKSKESIPNAAKRDFYLVAAFLEKADKDFMLLRNLLTNYEETVAKEIEETPEIVDINSASLKSYILDSELVKELDQKLAKINGVKLDNSNVLFIDEAVGRLHYLDVHTIKKLDTLLQAKKDIILTFASRYVRGVLGSVDAGLCIFYLLYILVADTNDLKKIQNFFVTFVFGYEVAQAIVEDSITKLLSAYNATTIS